MSKADSKNTSGGEGGGKSNRRILKPRRSRLAFFTMLMLVVLSAGTYTLYYFGHSDDLRDYYLRRLLVSTDNAEQEIDRLKRNFERNVQFQQDDEDKEGATEKGKDSKKVFKFNAGQFADKLELIPAFESSSDTSCEPLLKIAKPDPNKTEVDVGTITLAGWAGSAAILCFSSTDDNDLTLSSPPAKLAGLLRSVLPIEDFDSVLLARQTGEVLLLQQDQHMAIDVVSLDVSEIQEFEHIASQEHEPAKGLELEHTAIGEISLAEKKFLTFIQPLRIPIEVSWVTAGSSTPEHTWFLMGLKEEGRFRAEAMRISPTAMLVIMSLAILALFALPYLKLRFIGSREALHRHDILVLSIALMVALASITLAMLELHMREKLQDDIDARLNLVADDISDSFKSEVGAIASELECLTAKKSSFGPDVNEDGKKSLGGMLLKIPEEDLSCGDEPLLSRYPLLEMAYWMDEEGEQVEKWSIKETTTTLINVGDRDYYRDARDQNFTNSMDLAKDSPGWALESVRSKNTGEVSSVLAIHAENPGAVKVSAVYTALQSVIRPVLPPGFQFAIIDDRGHVLFHHDPSRNLRENLFEWVNKEAEIKSAVWSGNNWPEFDVVYQARDYRAHLRPLRSTPWSLVVFYDVHDSRLARVDILTVAFLFYLMYLILFLAMYFYLWAGTRETMKNPFFIWLWPSRERVHVYIGTIILSIVGLLTWWVLYPYKAGTGFVGQAASVALAALLGLIIFGFFYKLMRLSNTEKLRFTDFDFARSQFRSVIWYAVTVLLAILASLLSDSMRPGVLAAETIFLLIVLHFIAVHFSRPFNSWSPKPATAQKLHLVSLCAVVGVITVLPLFMFYGIAHDEVIELTIKREQRDWAAALSNRYQRQADRYQGISLDQDSAALIKKKLALTGSGSLGPAWDIHGVNDSESGNSGFSAREQAKDVCEVKDNQKHPADSGDSTSKAVKFAAGLIPGFTAESHELRSLASAHPSDVSCWTYGEAASGGSAKSLVYTRDRYRSDVGIDADNAGDDNLDFIGLRLQQPISYYSEPAVSDKTFWLALLVIVILVGITKNLLRYVYLMDLKFPVFLRGDRWPDTDNRRHKLVLRGSDLHQQSRDDKFSYHTIDTTHIESDDVLKRMLGEAISSGKDAVSLTHFHIGLWNAEVANRKLALLERLLTTDLHLEVRSDINPMHFFLMRSRDYLRGYSELNPDLGRWSAVLAEFTRCRPSHDSRKNRARLLAQLRRERPTHGKEKTTIALKLLADECYSHHELEEIAVSIARHPGFTELAADTDFPNSLINQVLDQADPYYRLLWAISSKDERMVLYHVAVNGFISWRSSDVLRRLVYRGLIEMVPHPRVMNRSFWQYVQNAEMPEVLEQWTAEAGSSGWARLKGPLLVMVGLAVMFLFSTQPQLLRQGIAFTAILAAGAPALIKLISMAGQARLLGGSK